MAEAGYSGTPLAGKLGIVGGRSVAVLGCAMDDYTALLHPVPDGVVFATTVTPATDIAHLFASRREHLEAELSRLRAQIRPDAAIWVSWPKKASRVPTDITEDVIREVCLPMGLVDVKVCAVDATWSGLKLVIRKALRPGGG